MPPYLLLFGFLVRIDERFHAHVIQTVGFHHVDYLEAVLHIPSSIRHRKIVPLGVSSRIIICREYQVVLIVGYLDDSLEVSRLEAGFKHQ